MSRDCLSTGDAWAPQAVQAVALSSHKPHVELYSAEDLFRGEGIVNRHEL